MKKIFLIFPIHLYHNIDLLYNFDYIYILEEPRYFTDFNFHKLKIAYHRSTMKYYYNYLKNNNIKNIKYINFYNINKDFYKNLSKYEIHTYDTNDNKLNKNKFIFHNNPNFLINNDIIINNINKFSKIKNGLRKFNFMNFYKFQRIRLNILIKNGKPVGGKWSFDKNNRKKIPNTLNTPNIPKIISNQYIKEAIKYTNKYFNNNYGSLDYFIYPIDHKTSIEYLKIFLEKKFNNFGPYEDAVIKENNFLWHSILTPMLNIGLLTDEIILNEVLKYENKVDLPSYEGFIRQLIGWRNYVYMIYLCEGENIRKMNYLNSNNKLTKNSYHKFWSANTGILPIDNTINDIIKYSYTHHILRLMYIGGFMLMCNINPNDVYKLFMEWTIDAYDWVMIPNVYSMSQFADGGIMMKRPYFCSSNYIIKMSNYKKDKWCEIWNDIYYNFINKNINILKHIYSTAQLVKHWNNKKDKDIIKKRANIYITKLLN